MARRSMSRLTFKSRTMLLDQDPELLDPHTLPIKMGRRSSFSTLEEMLSTFSADERGDGDMHGSSDRSGNSVIDMESLPNEVLIRIAQNVQGDQKVATLRDFYKVSRRMDSIVRKELYHTVKADTWPRLRRPCRTIEDCPALGQYIVELELLFPGYRRPTSGPSWAVARLDDSDLSMLYFLFLGILKGTANLRKLNMMPIGVGQTVRAGGPPRNLYDEFIAELSGIIRRSKRGGSTTVVLPLLEQVRLGAGATWEDATVYLRSGLAQPMLFLPFLHLTSMSSLESIDDSGVWPGSRCHSQLNFTAPSAYASHTHPHHQIKSVVLRESNCVPMDIMDICDIFPDMQVFFCQNRPKDAVHDVYDVQAVTLRQLRAAPSAKRYLTESFGKLQNLETLALVPLLAELSPFQWKTRFSGPSGFLSLTGLPALTSLATLISVFASPDGETTGVLTASPMEILPRSLRSLQIIVDHWTCRSLAGPDTRLDENWFQPREAALKFLGALAGICAREFPALRKVEYVWAVDRSLINMVRAVDMPYTCEHCTSPSQKCLLAHELIDNEVQVQCGGWFPFCCDKHTRIQALSPDQDYTTKAEGIVSPFKDRFDSLGAAFNEANVVFRIVELKEYSDFYAHWQAGRE